MNGVTMPNWPQFVLSRRGYVSPSNNILDQNPTAPTPTEFIAPFRSYDATSLSAVMGGQWMSGTNPNEIQAGLLRADAANPRNPLFQLYSTADDVNNTFRNPYFHYAELMRMANLTTTRSNVYAVWVTVGYFEVTPATPKPWMSTLSAAQIQQIMQQAYPDGYELQQELGSDTGEIVRHRGFYIIDRSIPVGFQRGQDLNVEKAILLKRFIE
jgi:hypothetical protein